MKYIHKNKTIKFKSEKIRITKMLRLLSRVSEYQKKLEFRKGVQRPALGLKISGFCFFVNSVSGNPPRNGTSKVSLTI
jgi:hypothetical protein